MVARRIRDKTRPLRERVKSLAWSMRPKKNYLEVMAIFKNEGDVLDEWISHYLSQGVDSINLINNASNDNYMSIIAPYLDDGRARLWDDPRKHIQYIAYNERLPLLRTTTEWLLICDLDEFVYARRPFTSIRAYLKTLPFSVSSVQVLWKNFGSSGHKKQPPRGIRRGFTHRIDYRLAKPTWGMNSDKICCKYITRTSRVRNLGLHRADLFWGANQLSDGHIISPADSQPISEELLERSALHLNHYFIQSEDRFRRVKATRGSAISENGEPAYTIEYFMNYDWNDIEDLELSDMCHG